MRRTGWLTLGLALTAAAVAPASGAAEAPRKLGQGPAYETLARLPVLHQGRIKPLDTLAREEVKQIFGRETIKLQDAARGNTVVETWGPVAALFDWSVRPEFWDDQPFILVEYLPLKRLILGETVRARVAAVLEKKSLSDADRAGLRRLTEDPNLSAGSVNGVLGASSLPKDDPDRKALAALAAELSEEHKWLTPRQLEEATIVTGIGQKLPFRAWFAGVVEKKRKADASASGEVRLTEVESRGYDVGTRLVHYQAIRDRNIRSVEPLLVMPRPSNEAYLAFLGETVKSARKTGIGGMTPIQLDAAQALDTYWTELPVEERAVPGTDKEFDKGFAAWLRGSSAWVPLAVLLDTRPEVLTEAGFPGSKLSAFLQAFKDLERAEASEPGRVPVSKASALEASARALGEAVNPERYPNVAAVDRETYFNESNPFWKAPMAYGLATVLLAVSLGFLGFERGSFSGRFGRFVYGAGLLGLAAGVGLEVFGFYLRVGISGWAPVTNMYETVIWVSLVAAVLGLVFEAIYRSTYPALAGSGVALLGTVLAANVPLLDPNIKQLQPVLRDNFWLTIHVLTEVSSYGAFLMAAGLGLIGTVYYVTATYRRSPTLTELSLPLVPGLPLLAVGSLGLLACYGFLGPGWAAGGWAMFASGAVAAAGGVLAAAVPIMWAGEAYSRLTFREDEALDEAAVAGAARAEASLAHAATSVQTVSVGEASGAGAVATLSKPTVAEIRALAAANRPKVDARGRAMQETAAKIKPLSNFIYRTMQVGVLLIAAGTILGGIWADYSWGRFWGWDPKEVWALITLLVYLIPLHGRFAGWFNTFALVAASVVCSLSVIMAWYGVNFVLGVGLHSYGFVEGGGQFSVFTTLTLVMALPFAAYWRRMLGSRPVLGDA